MKRMIVGMRDTVGTDSTAVAVEHHVLLKIVKDVGDLLSWFTCDNGEPFFQ